MKPSKKPWTWRLKGTPRKRAHAWGGLAAAMLLGGMQGCANDIPAVQGGADHVCQAGELVAFSCTLHDGRLLSLCAAPGSDQFKGASKDYRGYVYVGLGTANGTLQHRYPGNPRQFGKYMYKGTGTAVQPYVHVVNEKRQLFLAFDMVAQVEKAYAPDVTPYQPRNFDISSGACAQVHGYRRVESLLNGVLPFESEWDKAWDAMPATERAR